MTDLRGEMSESKQLKSGRYFIHGQAAWCAIDEDRVRISYDDGSYTCMSPTTFINWRPVPQPSPQAEPAHD